jgi:hypothetical protein
MVRQTYRGERGSTAAPLKVTAPLLISALDVRYWPKLNSKPTKGAGQNGHGHEDDNQGTDSP